MICRRYVPSRNLNDGFCTLILFASAVAAVVGVIMSANVCSVTLWVHSSSVGCFDVLSIFVLLVVIALIFCVVFCVSSRNGLNGFCSLIILGVRYVSVVLCSLSRSFWSC